MCLYIMILFLIFACRQYLIIHVHVHVHVCVYASQSVLILYCLLCLLLDLLTVVVLLVTMEVCVLSHVKMAPWLLAPETDS